MTRNVRTSDRCQGCDGDIEDSKHSFCESCRNEAPTLCKAKSAFFATPSDGPIVHMLTPLYRGSGQTGALARRLLSDPDAPRKSPLVEAWEAHLMTRGAGWDDVVRLREMLRVRPRRAALADDDDSE